MRFSIITVTYNSEKFLRQTLDSVACQNYKDYEHILWDGGSTDQTLEIVREYPHVKVFCGKDQGISDAMNKGAQRAQGQFLLHLHSDDCLAHPNVLQNVDFALKQHSGIKWLYGQTQIINSQGAILSKQKFVPFSLKKLKKYNIISHPATFIDRSFFLAHQGFKLNFRYCMDYDLWLRLAHVSAPFALPAILTSFREHHQSLSTSQPLAVADEAYRVRNQFTKGIWHRWQSYRTWQRRRRKILEK